MPNTLFSAVLAFVCVQLLSSSPFWAQSPDRLTQEPPAANAIEWTSLFNGKDLSGWDVYVTPAQGDKTTDPNGEGMGLNPANQTAAVVQEDGSVRIEGRLWGGINTKDSYRDYHFRLETRWGEAKFAPRANRQRDSGLIFHAKPPHGAYGGFWMGGCEYQIQERDFGDFFPLTTPRVTTSIDPTDPKGVRYHPDGTAKEGHQSRVQRSVQREMAHGEWNVCEVIARRDEVVHITNGLVNNRYSAVKDRTTKETLDSGMIQLQSEGAEVFYRGMQIRSLGEAALAGQVPEFEVISEVDESKAGCQRVTFTNRGSRTADVVAFELMGQGAGSVELALPVLPAALAPGDSIVVSATPKPLEGEADPDALPLQLGVETLAGPAHARVQLR